MARPRSFLVGLLTFFVLAVSVAKAQHELEGMPLGEAHCAPLNRSQHIFRRDYLAIRSNWNYQIFFGPFFGSKVITTSNYAEQGQANLGIISQPR
ncbi:MAG TPA: hypothetical protein VMF66_15430 [Candidatus Acidoferrum sp.]|nr:hypothetical protein [Candidatus Acidoferrum sp.]